MDEALIQNAQDDIDHDHGDQQQHAHILGRALERRRGALEDCLHRCPACRLAALASLDRGHGIATSALPGGRSKESVTAGTCPEWLTLSGMVPAAIVVTADSGTSWPVGGR